MKALKTIFNNYLYIGVKESQHFSMQTRLKYSNLVALVNVILLAIPFIVISATFFPSLTYLPIIFLVFNFFSILLIFFGFFTIGRFIIAIIPAIIGTLYHALIINASDTPLISMSLIIVACAIIPFIVFEIKEKVQLIISISICILMLISINKLNYLLEIDINNDILKTPFSEFITFSAGVLIILIYTYILANTTKESEKNIEELTNIMDNKNTEIDDIKQQLNKAVEEMEAFKTEQTKLKELETQREWINSGITKFVDILRLNNDNIVELTYNVISNLVKYLKANQGGIFMLVEEKNELEEAYFELTAAYAFNKRKYLTKKILWGEGLVGNCALEKKYILLTDIPTDYIKITSGLGEALPKSLLLIPIINENKVYGVIEIASFYIFKDYEIEFVNKVAENIGSAILNTMMHNKTNSLIKEMKKQAEYSQTQEEEMRQNIEEMQATQEEMAKKEAVLKELAEEMGINDEVLAERINNQKGGY